MIISMKSPISGSSNTSKVLDIPAVRIIEGYRESFNIDVAEYFTDLEAVEVWQCLDTGYRFYAPHVNLEGKADFYSALQKFPWYYMESKWEYGKALELIAPACRVLEIGSGAGAFLKKLTHLNVSNVGLEVCEAAVARAKSAGISLLNMSLTDFALNHQSKFDVVCLFQVLEHIHAVAETVDSAIKLLNKDGKLLVSVPNNDSFISEDENCFLNMPPHHVGLWNESSLRKLADYFPITVTNIFLEPMQSYHLRYFHQVRFGQALVKRFGFVGRLLSAFIYVMAFPILLMYSRRITGQTILVEFKRK